jgi:ribosomal-protein-alanine N-acetyltransferase
MARLHAEAFDAPWSKEALCALIDSAGVQALADHERRGFILLRVAADDAEILTLAVGTADQRRGVGTGLVLAAREAAEQAGAHQLALETACDNTAALALYQGCGFKVVGRRRGYYQRERGAVDAVVLVATLKGAP